MPRHKVYTDDQVREMRALRKAGVPVYAIAAQFGCTQVLVGRITTWRSHAHVDPELAPLIFLTEKQKLKQLNRARARKRRDAAKKLKQLKTAAAILGAEFGDDSPEVMRILSKHSVPTED